MPPEYNYIGTGGGRGEAQAVTMTSFLVHYLHTQSPPGGSVCGGAEGAEGAGGGRSAQRKSVSTG